MKKMNKKPETVVTYYESKRFFAGIVEVQF